MQAKSPEKSRSSWGRKGLPQRGSACWSMWCYLRISRRVTNVCGTKQLYVGNEANQAAEVVSRQMISSQNRSTAVQVWLSVRLAKALVQLPSLFNQSSSAQCYGRLHRIRWQNCVPANPQESWLTWLWIEISVIVLSTPCAASMHVWMLLNISKYCYFMM